MSDEAGQFLTSLFDALDGKYWFYLWTLHDKQSHWFQIISDADLFVSENADKDVYVGLSFIGSPLGDHDRIKRDNAAGFVALVADIDLDPSGESKKSAYIPRTESQAMGILNEVPLRPTMIVDSGHGYHAWWVLEEPWIFDDEEEREEAALFAQRWGITVKNSATRMGFALDTVSDLARVMRVPNTTNAKVKADPRPTRLIEIDATRTYDKTHIEEFLADIPEEPVESVIIGETITLDPAAEPPRQWLAVMTNDDYSRSLFKNEAEIEDRSASGYDMALANIAAEMEWAPQDIVNLLIAHRRENRHDLKLRLDYYIRTVEKAINWAKKKKRDDQANRAIEDLFYMQNQDEPRPGPIPESEVIVNQNGDLDLGEVQELIENRNRLLKTISKAVDAEIRSIKKYRSSPQNTYVININGMDVTVEGPRVFSRQSEFRDLIIDTARVNLRAWKTEAWRVISQAMLDAIEEIDTPLEATEMGEIQVWIEDFLESSGVLDSYSGIDDGRVVLREDGVYLSSKDLIRHVRVHYGRPVNSRRLTTLMRHMGFTRHTLSFTNPRTSKSMWRVPDEITPMEVPDSSPF